MFKRLSFRAALVCGLVVLGSPGCANNGGSSKGDAINAVCTTGMVADLVTNVGGDRVRVTQLMGAGVDPHLYKASPGDVSKLSAADVIFYSGLHLEGKMADLFARMAERRPTCAVTQHLDHKHVLDGEQAGSAHDPH